MAAAADPTPPRQRLHLRVTGAVQGVGFRPFVYHLAQTLGITGWVRNTPEGVILEVEGTPAQLQAFQTRLPQEKPAHAQVQTVTAGAIAPVGDPTFVILASAAEPTTVQSQTTTLILPDLATCPACLRDIFDPASRHYSYPFTNCTHCGPRFSIVRSLPYDRARTTLSAFPLCPACQAEYDDPSDRRFHAQPNACPACGPQLALWNGCGQVLATREAALRQGAAALRAGKVLALKGLGGFHLMVDARNASAVNALRDRKHRPDKPLAVMFPSLDQVASVCHVSPLAATLLQSAAAPIVLLPKRNPQDPQGTAPLAAGIAPGNPYLGALLPYTPLHHLLLAELGFPVVATSGNRSGEPIGIDEIQGLETLAGIADVFLVHNRPIARPVDDSIVQIVQGEARLLRRARGYAPFPIALPEGLDLPEQAVILAVGGHLKNTVALYVQGQLLVSQHLGDLGSVASRDRCHEAIRHLGCLYRTAPTVVACDAHPDYASTTIAHRIVQELTPPRSGLPPHGASSLPLVTVQHHYAHVLAALVDAQWHPPVLGVAWDGAGYGLDGTIWGGECLWVPEAPLPAPGFIRVAHLRPFPLPGGEQAMRDPRRCALGLLYGCWGDTVFERQDLALMQGIPPRELGVLKTMLQRGVNTPLTSSMGRLFDAIAALLGLCTQASFEGQAAMALEFAIGSDRTEACYPFPVRLGGDRPGQFDYEPMVMAILQDLRDHVPPGIIAATFHNTLVAALVAMACQFRQGHPEAVKIVLTGGCFQNRYLLARSLDHLQRQDFWVRSPQQLPCNDGGLAPGQVMAVLRHLERG